MSKISETTERNEDDHEWRDPSQSGPDIRQASVAIGNHQSTLFWRWQQSTLSANQALLAQHLQIAGDHYQHALELAEQLKQQDCQQESNLAAFVISLHNIADLALLTGDPEQARRALTRAFRELWLQMKQQPAVILLPHLQVCRRELAFFCQNFGSDPAAKALLQLPWPQHLYGH